ncbi:MAG: hypothetical protein HRJ53_20870 [Acidobacteria bacterium Pan2503]|uniref:Uncharacterized protein n=1 Tax=Candidatus Acidiferrum panamense TaxID=2741543 RepID=A0A7V8NUE5_9BACT|nr:hypothetical protein [Candidatus Acidoferrum panamensis]
MTERQSPSSRLTRATIAVLREHRPQSPFLPNVQAAEMFDAAHSFGELKVLPRSDGGYVVVDTRRPMGGRTLSWHPTISEADEAMRRWAEREGIEP